VIPATKDLAKYNPTGISDLAGLSPSDIQPMSLNLHSGTTDNRITDPSHNGSSRYLCLSAPPLNCIL
jgi:hypothetical protein